MEKSGIRRSEQNTRRYRTMEKSKEKIQVIRSMRDFQKIYFPKSFEKQMLEMKKRKERGNQK